MDGVFRNRMVASHLAEAAGDLSSAQSDALFEAMIDRNAALMYRVALTLLRNPPDAEDAVQETLLKLYRTGGWRQIDDERAFLTRSVWRTGLTRLGTGSVKAMRRAEDVAGMNLPSPANSPEDEAIGADRQALLRRLLDQLPENFRQALILSSIEGLRGHEVAELLGIPEATVRTRVLRAKAELRRLFLATCSSRKEALR